MKPILSTLLIAFLWAGATFGQKISETNFSLGINKTSSPDQQMYWNENPPPTYLTLNASKLWYQKNHLISFGKDWVLICNIQILILIQEEIVRIAGVQAIY